MSLALQIIACFCAFMSGFLLRGAIEAARPDRYRRPE